MTCVKDQYHAYNRGWRCEHMSVGDTGCDGFCVGGSCETPHNETAGFMAAVMHDIALAKHDAPVCAMTERPGHIDGCTAHHSGPCWTKARTP